MAEVSTAMAHPGHAAISRSAAAAGPDNITTTIRFIAVLANTHVPVALCVPRRTTTAAAAVPLYGQYNAISGSRSDRRGGWPRAEPSPPRSSSPSNLLTDGRTRGEIRPVRVNKFAMDSVRDFSSSSWRRRATRRSAAAAASDRRPVGFTARSSSIPLLRAPRRPPRPAPAVLCAMQFPVPPVRSANIRVRRRLTTSTSSRSSLSGLYGARSLHGRRELPSFLILHA